MREYPVQYQNTPYTLWGHDRGEYIANFLQEGRFYEEPLLRHIHARYADAHTIVDAGANIGNHTKFFSEVMGVPHVIAFEPNAENAALLRRNAPKAEVYECALSDRMTNAVSRGVQGNMGASRIRYAPAGTIPVITLDSLELAPSLIKIDVEDMEVAVIRGAIETIAKWKPRLIVEHQGIQAFYDFNRALRQTGVEYVVFPFVKVTWEMFEYVPVEMV